mmetsp:Transcript_58330/g.126820  ORF Transcript_58330/g.126820 Transcript_58330/m.126820 type:complete len:82 (-) Transcript_58330:367-612(-)
MFLVWNNAKEATGSFFATFTSPTVAIFACVGPMVRPKWLEEVNTAILIQIPNTFLPVLLRLNTTRAKGSASTKPQLSPPSL